MTQTNLQVSFFQHLKAQIPSNLSMVDEIADLLNISNDSAYRRIRGEKQIDLEEIQKLCVHFKISLDQLMNLQGDAFIFSGKIKNDADSVFDDWLDNVYGQFKIVDSLNNKHIYYLMKDIPPLVHFQIPELAAFKFFFWMKSILHHQSLKGIKFRLNDPRYGGFHQKSDKILALYNNIPTTEIWNIESVNSSLRQIQFHYEAGSFANADDVRLLYQKMEELVAHIELQAELGVKFRIGEKPKSNAPEYRLFVNELILGDNTFMIDGDVRMTFLNHSVLYFVGTRNERFNDAMFENLRNLIKKSTHISGVGEKERSQFFNRVRKCIHEYVAQI